MTLDGNDIFEGFMVNYHKLELSDQDKNTTWTHRILGYFDILGRMLGYKVHYEKLRYDLTWWDYSKEEYFFYHLEHENSSSKKRKIEETIKQKVLNSDAEIAMAICYPNNEKEFNSIKEWINKNSQTLLKPNEVIIILDGSYWGTVENISFSAFIISKEKIEHRRSKKIMGEDDIFTIVL